MERTLVTARRNTVLIFACTSTGLEKLCNTGVDIYRFEITIINNIIRRHLTAHNTVHPGI
jgi:hypothetical protein